MPDTVKVRATKWHTHNGEAHAIGDVYDLPADLVDSVQGQGMAVPVEDERPAQAPKAKK